MGQVFSILIIVGGGLGTFLLGMKHLSEGLQAVSGSGLRRFMSLATTHRLAGVGTGVITTVIVQSSSIITVMVVGFVSSGLMNLSQAINVIIGSNIGTTATAWLIAFAPDVKMLGLCVVLVGAAFYFFQRNERLHNLGLAFMGLGCIFMGLYWMKEGMEPVRSMPVVVDAFRSLDATTAWGLAKCVLVSLVFTAVVQSSAATTAIAMTLAQQGLLSFEAAAATVFGMNIGTTMTAWLAAFNGSAEARQTALAHTLFNVAGTILLIPFFIPAILPLATSFFPHYADAVTTNGVTTYPHIAAPMAAVHTLFNLITTLFFLPFSKRFAAFVERIIKIDPAMKPHLSALNMTSHIAPVIACDQALLEVQFMRDSDLELLSCVRSVIAGESDERTEEHILHREGVLDNVQREVTEFLGKIMVKRAPAAVSARVRRLLRMSDELESVSDEAAAILKATRRIRKDGQMFSAHSRGILMDVHGMVAAFAADVSARLKSPRPRFDLAPVQSRAHEIGEAIRRGRRGQLDRVGPDDPASPIRVLAELDILNAYERIRSYYLNIAETLAGGK
ncbi:MAG: Na/Pi cotransporter family protein [Kiritimatiellae bacterium]|nr:Na/Pi cotransporter family protein [Kiritimatiellia bacterium]MBQ2626007.1 Na/Pi cotransporter family protein [Kiritimatiellia bacterium]